MSAKRNLKRALSSLLAGVMLAGLLPTAAFAAGESSDQQIEKYGGKPVYYSWTGSGFEQTTESTDPKTSNNPSGGAPEVITSKTIAGTEEENQFDITL